jgi:hypothetical protein
MGSGGVSLKNRLKNRTPFGFVKPACAAQASVIDDAVRMR